MKKAVFVTLVGLGLVTSSFSNLVVFDMLDDPAIYLALDGKATASVTNGGVVVTFTASEGVLNRTASGFGINGPGADATDALNLGQYIDLVFDQSVLFSNVNVSSWGILSAGEVRLWQGSSYDSQGSIWGTGDTPYNFVVEAGETVRIIATAETSPSNGFSVDSFTISIPEPAAIGFIVLTGISFLLGRRVLSA
ncbi:MAG: hypothetical protein K9M54_07880 [Kiritimatiellales bacterium]|nr:hypothetical protein [Kiritimatiellales bacterium]